MPLDALFESLSETVNGTGEDLFERRYGFWRGLLDGVVARYLDCGSLKRGFARIRCLDCAAEYQSPRVYFLRLLPGREEPSCQSLTRRGYGCGVFETRTRPHGHGGPMAGATREQLAEVGARLARDRAGDRILLESGQCRCDLPEVGCPQDAQNVEPILRSPSVRRRLALGDLVQLGHEQCRETGDRDAVGAGIDRIERGQANDGVVDDRRFEALRLARDFRAVRPQACACQVAPEFPPQFAPESPPSRCDVRTGPMGSSPVSSLFSASLQ